MSLNLKSLASGRACIAAAAICLATAPSARAELTLQVTGAPGTTQTAMFTNASGGGTGSFTFAGYTLAYTVTSTGAPGSQQLTLGGTLTRQSASAPNTNSFSFVLTGTGFSNPTVNSSAVLRSISDISTNFQPPVAGSMNSTGTVSSGATSISAFSSDTSTSAASNGSVGPFPITPAFANSFNLSTNGNFSIDTSTVPTSGALTFTSSVQVFAVPEPASVVAGLMGLPCMGAALAFLRRRVTAVVA